MKNKGGRPTVMTDIVLGKLTDAFSWGCTDREACIHADISEDTLYEYCKKHPEFSELKERKKENPILKAKETVLNKMTESYGNAMDYLKRKRKDEFGDIVKNEVEVTGLENLDDNTLRNYAGAGKSGTG